MSTDTAEDEVIWKVGDPWSVRLVVESGDLADPDNAIGQLPTAKNRIDQHDLEELEPTGMRWLTLLFEEIRGGTDAWGYNSDFRSMSRIPRGTWHFVVRASEDVEEATLRLEGPQGIIEGILLYDKQTRRWNRLGQNGTYTFALVDGEAQFKLRVKYKKRRWWDD